MAKQQWLQQEPDPTEISKNSDGSDFIPIGIIEPLLDELTDGDWSTSNFKYSTQVYGTTLLISASVELSVRYKIKTGEPGFGVWDTVRRRISGAVTFTDATHGSNLNFAATALSECIKNAAKKLGPRFGRNLNDRGAMLAIQDAPSLKPKMDVITAKKYENAKKIDDIKTMLEISNNYRIE